MYKNRSNNTNPFLNRGFSVAWLAFLIVSVSIGLYARFRGLGQWPLTDDEFYIAQSIENILNSALPRFDCGGYYTRGLLYQYLSAVFLYISPNKEFVLRAIPAFFNLLSFPLVYWLGRRIGGKTVAYISLILFSLSTWEIEFARFARMYSLFQFFFLCYVAAFYKVSIDNDKRYEKWMFITTVFAVFTYEGAVFLAILNFIPFLFLKRTLRQRNIWFSTAIFLFVFIFLSFNFRRLGVADISMDESLSVPLAQKSPIIIPLTMVSIIFESPHWTIVYTPVLILYLVSVHKIIFTKNLELLGKFAQIFIISAAILHQFALFIGCLAIFLCLNRIPTFTRFLKNPKPIFLSTGISLGFWTLFGIINSEWCRLIDNPNCPNLVTYLKLLFNYPNIYSFIVGPWLKVFPLQSMLLILVVSTTFIYLYMSNSDDNHAGFFLLVSIFTIIFMIIGIINTNYISTRYTFFIYPIAILLGAFSLTALVRALHIKLMYKGLILLLLTAIYISTAEDYSFSHVIHISTPEINFRKNYNKALTNHYYNRLDYRSPAVFINNSRHENEPVFTIFPPTFYYLEHLDYVFIDAKLSPSRFVGQAACGGERELWTNAKLIYQKRQLFEKIDNKTSTTWVIAGSPAIRSSKAIKAISDELYKRYHHFIVDYSVDKELIVYRILNKKEHPL